METLLGLAVSGRDSEPASITRDLSSWPFCHHVTFWAPGDGGDMRGKLRDGAVPI